ncbi:alpha-tocopherol transfer protein-like [Tropilaelaps mercedesae]|uniref:Alpha-tocopherol transfer protein-like n=1 Tax=Tropilaelaps mercedesae TaxID=418985 RepID=A0A1V9XEG3_9ACAR|nr:alpha-tocopherol transfer protein-like [Tropilaelaps mercedesae]
MQLLGFAQESYPLRIKKMHIVNQSYLWNVGYAIGKHFVPSKLRERYILHGRDMSSLHQHVPREILPDELGGLTGPLDYWFIDPLYQLHDRIVKESHYGYDA